MFLAAYMVTYVDDREPGSAPRTMPMVVGAHTPQGALAAEFQRQNTTHYVPSAFAAMPVARVDSVARSMALDAIAREMNIAVLDHEDDETVRTRLNNVFRREVTNRNVMAALQGIRDDKGRIPLVTETEDGEMAVMAACMKGIKAARQQAA